MRNNVVITGATSFIGSKLIEKLISQDYNVFAIVRKDSKNIDKLKDYKNINIIEINMNEIDKLSEKIGKCDIFFHLAWEGTRGPARDDKIMQKENYVNSMKAVKVAAKLGCRVFIDAGSQAEYGVNNNLISEKTKCNPVTEYGKSKLNFYNDAYKFCKLNNINFKEPRFFSLYGPGDYEGTLVISTINKMLNNETIEFTKGIQMWNFLYLDDAIDGIIKLATVDCPDGAYNFGGNETKQLKLFIDDIYEITKSKSSLKYGVIPYHPSGMVSIQPDTTKLINETNWVPKVSFKDGIRIIIDNIQKEVVI